MEKLFNILLAHRTQEKIASATGGPEKSSLRYCGVRKRGINKRKKRTSNKKQLDYQIKIQCVFNNHNILSNLLLQELKNGFSF